MLRKLLKHEFRATARIMGPLYLVLLITALGANLTTRGLLATRYRLLDLVGVLLVMAFFIAIVGVCVMSMVVMVRRFYQNLLRDEGYLMMTLPVSIHQQVWSKLIVSAVWFAATFLAVMLAFCVMALDVSIVEGFAQAARTILQEITAYYALNGAALMGELLLLAFFGCCAMCLHFYAALAVGHSFSNHKMAWSVLWYFVFSFASQFLFGALMLLMDELPLLNWVGGLVAGWSAMAQTHLLMVLMIAGCVVYGAVFYVVTVWFLKRHLDLE